MNLSVRQIWRGLLIVLFFIATFLTFAMITFVVIEIALFLFITIANYEFSNNDAVLLAVCILSLIGSLVVTSTFFLKQSSRLYIKSDQPLITENDNTHD
jgi:hypothetical protein